MNITFKNPLELREFCIFENAVNAAHNVEFNQVFLGSDDLELNELYTGLHVEYLKHSSNGLFIEQIEEIAKTLNIDSIIQLGKDYNFTSYQLSKLVDDLYIDHFSNFELFQAWLYFDKLVQLCTDESINTFKIHIELTVKLIGFNQSVIMIKEMVEASKAI